MARLSPFSREGLQWGRTSLSSSEEKEQMARLSPPLSLEEGRRQGNLFRSRRERRKRAEDKALSSPLEEQGRG